MSKAWICRDEEWCRSEVVFADTRGKAKSYFKAMETFDYFEFCELRPRRLKKLDYLNHPDGYVMDWLKDEDRLPMVRDADFYCNEIDRDDCKECCAKEWCSKYMEVEQWTRERLNNSLQKKE